MSNGTSDPTHGHQRSLDNLSQAHPVFMAPRTGLAWGLFLNSTWFSRMGAPYLCAGVLVLRSASLEARAPISDALPLEYVPPQSRGAP